MLNKEHPLSQNYNIPVYFTDVFEMEETKQDPTTQVLRQIWTVASAKEYFQCSTIEASLVANWREQYKSLYDRIIMLR